MVCTVKELLSQFKLSEENIPLSVLEFSVDEDASHFSKGNKNKNALYFTGEYTPLWNDEDSKSKLNLELVIDLTSVKVDVIDDFFTGKLDDDNLEYGDLIVKELTLERIKFNYHMEDNFSGFESYNIFGGLIQQS